MDEILGNLVQPHYKEPFFFINFIKFNRNFVQLADSTVHLQKKSSRCWKIVNGSLENRDPLTDNIFFDAEAYVLQVFFDVKLEETVAEKWLLYYWRGQNAAKGFTPLPPNVADDHPMDRICQWSEPAAFFQSFSKPLIVFAGEEKTFDTGGCHLLIIRGELIKEMHLNEVCCDKKSLRSKASFLLISPHDKVFIYWHGLQTSEHKRRMIIDSKLHELLKSCYVAWSNFTQMEVEEGSENEVFSSTLTGNVSDYYHLQTNVTFTPRLFYLNSTLGYFSVTEIENPLRTPDKLASFPFLQSHLYSADQPAFFILDNGQTVWLWQGPRTDLTEPDIFEKDFNNAKTFLHKYAMKREEILGHSVIVHFVNAYQEPLEFKNLFPTWADIK
ncbi:supervillin-like [Cylas formicarius]|uniref:supervillin-like n=1 Tax=Cylas formicarius TaxID=197179 RepID=UPI002958C0D5|nr:supervillin-like [Cylas formicarius]